MNHPKTIKIFLAEGKPTGLKIIELLGSTIQGMVIPRDSLKTALERDDTESQGVYFLIGEDNESNKLQVYIGESENFAKRILHHQRNKEFWNTAICFIAKDDNLIKTHVKYLEAVLTYELIESGRVKVRQNTGSRKPKLSESEEAYIEEFVEQIKLILAALGYPFLKKATEGEEIKEKYIFEGENFSATGAPTSEGFVVFAGSKCRKRETPSFQDTAGQAERNELLESDILVEDDDKSYRLEKDMVFNSPSRAGGVVAGRVVNGWLTWKAEDGRTLDEVKKAEAEDSSGSIAL